MSTLLLLYQFRPEHVELIREAAPGWKIVTSSVETLEKDHLLEAEIICGWHPSIVGAIDNPSKLKWIQTISAGIDRLPLDKLEQRNILLTSASGIHPISMTETFYAMLLAFTRNLHHAVRQQAQGSWKPSEHYSQLAGKTLGIVGVGTIGAEIARIAEAFGMHVLGIRRSMEPTEGVHEMFGLDSLDEVLSRSDAVVNVLPYMKETHHLFNQERFKHMKPSALFFNFGRGASVDTEALLSALNEGQLAGAGLDVFESEPLPSDHPLWAMDNVIITPHIGGWTDNYKQKMADLFIPNLRAYLSEGKPSTNLVDYKYKY